MVNEEAYILFVRKNAIVVLIPKYGLEGTVFFGEKDKPKPTLLYDAEVKCFWMSCVILFCLLLSVQNVILRVTYVHSVTVSNCVYKTKTV